MSYPFRGAFKHRQDRLCHCIVHRPGIGARAHKEWDPLALEIGEVPNFDKCFATFDAFYRSLPWSDVEAGYLPPETGQVGGAGLERELEWACVLLTS